MQIRDEQKKRAAGQRVDYDTFKNLVLQRFSTSLLSSQEALGRDSAPQATWKHTNARYLYANPLLFHNEVMQFQRRYALCYLGRKLPVFGISEQGDAITEPPYLARIPLEIKKLSKRRCNQHLSN